MGLCHFVYRAYVILDIWFLPCANFTCAYFFLSGATVILGSNWC